MKQRLKWMTSLLIALLFVIVLAACGGNSEEASGTEDDGKLKLVAGTEATYAPMEYIDENGEIVGIDIDIVNAIAEEIGAEVEFQNIGWDPLFPAVKNGEIDFAVSSITITEDRKEEYDFTEPYYVANQLILVPEDSDIKSFQDLKDKRVAVQISTTGHEVVKKLLGETSDQIVAPENLPLAINEMLNGNADAVVGDNAPVLEYMKSNPDVVLKTIEDDEFEKEYYGLMVRKGNTELLDILNEGIQKIKENGKLEEITGINIDEE
ncbi:MAG TPA: basic amino acid ABC transporter substrate-binding protein [Pseudogracilibacillus sp.]|nr:basic amino acid ABC transporter substrate-binding protein [Pseudogracilibacillus sp.]